MSKPDYRVAFIEFNSSRHYYSYERFSASIYAMKIADELTKLSKDPEVGRATPIFLVTEEKCKEMIIRNTADLSPGLGELIEGYLKVAHHLTEEAQLYEKRASEFPMCIEAINLVLDKGLKLIKIEKFEEFDQMGLYEGAGNKITICSAAQSKHLLHEFNHAFYQLPMLHNPFVEEAIDKQRDLQIQNKELCARLDELMANLK
jgi:hypothetical protein